MSEWPAMDCKVFTSMPDDAASVIYVTLVFINAIMDSIIDRFGSDVVVSYHDEEHSKVTVPVALSDAFYAWVIGMGKRIRIEAPLEAKEGIKKLLADVASKY